MNAIKPKVLQLPEVCQIPVGGGHIDVLCTKPTVGLWIEAACATFTLVQTAVIGKLPPQLKLSPAQAEAAQEHMADPDVAVANSDPESGAEECASE